LKGGGLAGRGLAVTVAAASAGAAAKVAGALYGSRAVLVDAFTSIANMAALAGILFYYKASMRPADLDHPYGHARLKYAGALLALLIYMFVAGLSAAEIYYSVHGYSVGSQSWKAALAGAAFYAAAIVSARSIDPVLRVYAGFTLSELIESAVSAAGSFLGSEVSYKLDLAGAVIILAYILYEASETVETLVDLIADKAAPSHVYQAVEREASLRGFRVVRIRIRRVDEGRYAGDILVEPREPMPPDVASLLAEEVRDVLARKGVDVAVSVTPPRRHRGGEG